MPNGVCPSTVALAVFVLFSGGPFLGSYDVSWLMLELGDLVLADFAEWFPLAPSICW